VRQTAQQSSINGKQKKKIAAKITAVKYATHLKHMQSTNQQIPIKTDPQPIANSSNSSLSNVLFLNSFI